MYLFLTLKYDLISVRDMLCSCLLLSICTVFMNTLYLADYLYLLLYFNTWICNNLHTCATPVPPQHVIV